MENNKQQKLIVELTFEFAVTIIRYATILENKKYYVIARQLLKSGTSIGATVRESQNAEILADFIHKMKIAAKDADETEYWLLLCNRIEGYPDCKPVLNHCQSIIKILAKIIGSSKRGI